MPVERNLLHGTATYSAIVNSESNYLLKLTYFEERNKFFALLDKSRSEIEAVVAYHLGLSPKECHVVEVKQWIHGTFNVCVPVRINHIRRVIIRFPLPYRVGEKVFSGNADEKVRCEAGAYAWLQQECPSIPIPYLHGFGLSNGQHYTSSRNLPWLSRWVQKFRRALLWIQQRQLPSNYIPRRPRMLRNPFGSYLVIDYIEKSEGQMLSETWDKYREDKNHLVNLLRGLSHLMLGLSHVQLPKIGSFIIDDDGYIKLANRPLTSILQGLENAGAAMSIMRDRTYTSVISYVSDLLSYHDNRLRCEPNGVKGLGDCVSQMCALTVMRAVASQFYSQNLDSGPFTFTLTDLHQSNIFVDDDWNITYIIDLEWAASLPVEFTQLPHWLGGKDIDAIEPEAYNTLHEEFTDILKLEEREIYGDSNTRPFKLSNILCSGWGVGTFWYNLALWNPPALHTLFYGKIQPQFAKHLNDQEFYRVVGLYWCRKAGLFTRQKINEKAEYDKQLKKAFQIND
ncbi:hypothetical protein FQN50_004374 [Emmonsiellopsis sp. PD_5]|nr:hypothetical protein FQN50_004374 [Emmonsiellopsis sp. PD_5]